MTCATGDVSKEHSQSPTTKEKEQVMKKRIEKELRRAKRLLDRHKKESNNSCLSSCHISTVLKERLAVLDWALRLVGDEEVEPMGDPDAC